MTKIVLTNAEVTELAKAVSDAIPLIDENKPTRLFGIPRGGIPAAMAVAQHGWFEVVDDPATADVLIDDLVDSGDTMRKWCDDYPGKHFYALIDKTSLPDGHPHKGWIVFPWEGDAVGSLADNIKRTLQYIGEDPERGGLIETPARVAKAWKFWCDGYNHDPAEVLKVFEDGGEAYNEMVIVKDIPIYSHCEHHMAAIFGTATIAYIPNGKIVGLSKLSRLAEIFARRLQVQERLTAQIADALNDHLKPLGVGVIIKARHLCMESRGICQQGHHTVTSALRGVMKEGAPRAEFLELAK